MKCPKCQHEWTPKPAKLNMRRFKMFYDPYPNKVARGDAEKAFAALDPNEGFAEMMRRSVQNQIKWRKDMERAGEFVPKWPNPATWIRQRRWEDNLPTPKNLPKASPGETNQFKAARALFGSQCLRVKEALDRGEKPTDLQREMKLAINAFGGWDRLQGMKGYNLEMFLAHLEDRFIQELLDSP